MIYFPGTQIPLTSKLLKSYRDECRTYPRRLVSVDASNQMLQDINPKPIEAWRSQTHAVYLWQDGSGFHRLTMHKLAIDTKTGRWADGLDWDTMMDLKNQAGFKNAWGVEVFPPDLSVVNHQNMRHIFLLPHKPDFAW